MRRVAHDSLAHDEIEAILARPISARIAFLDGDGFPRMVPCWFLWRDGAFHTTSDADKFHVRCLERDSRGSFCIDFEEQAPDRRSNRQVKGVGRFDIVDGAAGVLAAMRTKYLGETNATSLVAIPGRIVLRLAPDRISAHGSDMYYDVAERPQGVRGSE